MPRSATILLVEDNSDDVLLIRRAFKKLELPAQIVAVANGEAGVQYLYRESQIHHSLPKLILLDLYMPQMDGFQFIQWVREQPEFRHLPVVVLTGSAFSPDVKRAYQLGANSFLVKPNDVTELTNTLKELIGFWFPRQQSAPTPAPSQLPPTARPRDEAGSHQMVA